jgi:hypothetical protein
VVQIHSSKCPNNKESKVKMQLNDPTNNNIEGKDMKTSMSDRKV